VRGEAPAPAGPIDHGKLAEVSPRTQEAERPFGPLHAKEEGVSCSVQSHMDRRHSHIRFLGESGWSNALGVAWPAAGRRSLFDQAI
jgi:hypothetical protein